MEGVHTMNTQDSLPMHDSELDENEINDDDQETSEEEEEEVLIPLEEPDKYNHYHIRITTREKFKETDIQKFIEDAGYVRFLGAREMSPRGVEHYHYSITTLKEYDIQFMRDEIYRFLLPYWGNPDTGRMYPGYGPKQYYCKPVLEYANNLSYVVKDKTDLHYKGYREEEVNYIVSKSYKKIDAKATFTSKYRDLLNLFHNSDMTIPEFMRRLIQLKSAALQMINMQHIHQYALSAQCRRDPNYTWDLVNNYLQNK